MASKAGLTKEQVEHVARLASLPISSKEVSLFQAQLSQVVEYVSKISKAEDGKQKTDAGREKTEGGLGNVGRGDEAEGARVLSQDKATSGGKNVHNGLFVVPAIFEEI